MSLWSEGPLEWREASGQGTPAGVTRTHFPAPGFTDKLPYLQGVMQLHEGPRIFANITGAGLEQLRVGQRMRIVCEADDGPPSQFRPA